MEQELISYTQKTKSHIDKLKEIGNYPCNKCYYKDSCVPCLNEVLSNNSINFLTDLCDLYYKKIQKNLYDIFTDQENYKIILRSDTFMNRSSKYFTVGRVNDAIPFSKSFPYEEKSFLILCELFNERAMNISNVFNIIGLNDEAKDYVKQLLYENIVYVAKES